MTSMPRSINNVLTKYFTGSGGSKGAQPSSAFMLPHGTKDGVTRTLQETGCCELMLFVKVVVK